MRTINIITLVIMSYFMMAQYASTDDHQVQYRTVEIQGVEIFYREAGSIYSPSIVLLHGFPTSSHMYRNLINELANDFHLIAPDYPGFRNSEQPSMQEFEYSFDHLAEIMDEFLEEIDVKNYSLYLMDYGAPIGFRIATKHPERIEALIVQNGNAYEEGLRDFWKPIKKYWKDNSPENATPLAQFITPQGVKWQYTHGVRNPEHISPDNWNTDLQHLSRKGNLEIQLKLFYDYQTNVPLYPEWQEYFRTYQPPTLIVLGEHDYIFPAEGAFPYRRDLKNIELHILNTGHFTLEEDGIVIANYIRNFIYRNAMTAIHSNKFFGVRKFNRNRIGNTS